MRRIISSILTVIMMLLPLSSLGATGHINGCTNTDFTTNCCTKTFLITAKTGYEIVDVLVNGVSKGVITSYTFTNIAGPQSLKVVTQSTTGSGGGTGGAGTGSGGTAEGTYKIQFNANTGIGTMTSQIFIEGTTGDLKACTYTKQYYHCVGWSLTPGGEKVYNEAQPNLSITENLTLYAIWEPTVYTITYTLNGGTVATANPTTYTTESSTITLNNPTKTGAYDFTGWTGTNGTTPQTTITIPKGSGGNRTYTANWYFDVSSINLGDYVEYVPSTTTHTVLMTDSGYSSDQTFTPSSITSWRVLSKDNNQFILTADVGSVYLKGEIGYRRGVYAINELAKAYSNETYAESVRAPGYVAGTSVDVWTTSSLNKSTDKTYTSDLSLLSAFRTATGSWPFGTSWMASRGYSSTENYAGGTHDHYGLVNCSGYSSVGYTEMYNYEWTGDTWEWTKGSYTRKLLPIVTLKSNVTITGGSGTADAPYQLGFTN